MMIPTRQSVLFPALLDRPLHHIFDTASTTSEGGAMLLKRVDRKLGRTAAIGGCIRESRQEVKVKHSYAELCGQRIFGLALGYSDANDAGRIGGDPMMRIMIGRDPVPGADLASQRTVSRFKNAVSDKDLYRIGMTMAEKVVGYHGQASWPPGRADYHRHGPDRPGQLRTAARTLVGMPENRVIDGVGYSRCDQHSDQHSDQPPAASVARVPLC